MVNACTGYTISNFTKRSSDALIFSFPMDTLTRTLFVDVFTAGADVNFEGNTYYLIATCGMTSFSVGEPIPEETIVSVVSSLMTI